LSITMSVVDTFISPIITPILLETTVGHLIPIEFLPLIIRMLLIVLLPILLGVFVQLKFTRVVETVRPTVRFFSSLSLIFIILSVVSGSEPLLKDNLTLLPLLTAITIVQIVVPM